MYTRTCLPITNLNNLKSLPEPDKSNKTKIAWIKSISRQNPKWSMLVNEIFVCSCCSFAVSREKFFFANSQPRTYKNTFSNLHQTSLQQTNIYWWDWLVGRMAWLIKCKETSEKTTTTKKMDGLNEWMNKYGLFER